jgi:MSHA biogenesis protein MshI
MRFPWQRRTRSDRLVIGLDDAGLAWVHADGTRLRRCGFEPRGGDTPQAFAKRVRALGLPACDAVAVLPLEHAQLLQIEAPSVPAEELKAAARWRIKDMVEARLDELTLDVLRVGDGRERAAQQLFVAAAPNALVQSTGEWTRLAGLQLRVIDIRETTQRNLQSAAAVAAGHGARATAALLLHGTHALLTISAGGELFHARRIEGGAAALDAAPAAAAAAPSHDAAVDFDAMDIVDYGAEPGAGPAVDEVPRLVIELQRSLDLWERSWPDLPLAGVLVHAGARTEALVALLRRSLGQEVAALDAAALFPGLDEQDDTLREAVLPLLGALLRDEPVSA